MSFNTLTKYLIKEIISLFRKIMAQDLTPNGILKFFNQSINTDSYKPTVQINAIKKCGSG